MARIRSIKPEFFKHFELYSLEVESKLPVRLAFAGLWTVADREGRFKWIPEQLKIECLPYDKVDFSRVLDALTTRGFVVKYASDDPEDTRQYGYIPGFATHQVVNNRERESDLPNPSDCKVLTRGARVGDAWGTRGQSCKEEGKGKEGKGKEGKGTVMCERLFDIWNEKAEQHSQLSAIREITDDRRKKIKTRLAKPKYAATFEDAVGKLPIPNNERFTWQPDFDWLLANDTNALKVAEGKYDSNGSPDKPAEYNTDKWRTEE